MMSKITIREATPQDANSLMLLIKELAEFEKMPECVKMTEEQLGADLKRGAFHALIALTEDGQPAGMNLYYYAYSTWVGQYVHMEDLYIRPAYRRQKIGMKIWIELAKIAKKNGCERLQWNVLNWNTQAIKFYETMSCTNLSDKEGWLTYRMTREDIEKLATATP